MPPAPMGGGGKVKIEYEESLLTLTVPHFFDCGKNESTKAFSATLV